MDPGTTAQLASGAQAISQLVGGIAGNRQAERNAAITEAVGRINARETRRDTRRLVGAQIAAAGASGVDPTTGSALDIVLQTTSEGEKQALREKFQFDSSAFAQRAQGRALLVGGIGASAGTLLGAQQRQLLGVQKAEIEREAQKPTVTPLENRRSLFDARATI